MTTTFTTRQAAKKLGIDAGTLSRYISSRKIPEPKVVQIGSFRVHSWTDGDIERVRKLLPKIANGRKTRYQKKQSAVSRQQSGKKHSAVSTQQSAKAPARVPVPHKKRKPKQKK